MTAPCLRKQYSNPPVCGIHNVPLVQTQLPNELIASGYKAFTFLCRPQKSYLKLCGGSFE